MSRYFPGKPPMTVFVGVGVGVIVEVDVGEGVKVMDGVNEGVSVVVGFVVELGVAEFKKAVRDGSSGTGDFVH